MGSGLARRAACAVLLAFPFAGRSQDASSCRATHAAVVVTGGLVATGAIAVRHEVSAWGRAQGWHVAPRLALLEDPGTPYHMVGSQVLAQSLEAAARERCASGASAAWIAAAGAMAMGVAKELVDAPRSGFGVGDLAADAMGIAVAMAPRVHPALRDLTWSVSFDPRRSGDGGARGVHALQLATPLGALVPRPVRRVIPPVLRISAGRELSDPAGERAWRVGLDLAPVVPPHATGWRASALRLLRVVRLPGPVVRFSRGHARGVLLAW